jgi:hypothetical protein
MLTDLPFALMSLTRGKSAHLPAVMSSAAVLVLVCVVSLPDDAFCENCGHKLQWPAS